MEIKSKHLSGASVLKAAKQKQPTGNTAIPTSQSMDSIRFSGKEDHRIERVKEAAKQVDVSKDEVLVPHFFMGSLPLNELSTVQTELPPDQKLRLDTYIDLLEIALRENNNNKALLAKLKNPSPAMTRWLNELNLTAADFAKPVVNAHKIDQNNDIPPAVHDRMSKMGMYRLKIPKAYGGMEFNQREYSRLLSSLPRVCSSNALATAVSAHSTIGAKPLLMFGTPEQRAKYLPAIAKGDYLAAFGLTEPGAGTDLNKLSTTAELSADGKHWKLNGEKIFITGVPDSGVAYFVAGKTRVNGEDQGPTVFVVDLPFRLRQTKAEKKQLMYELAQKGLRITPFSWSDQKDKSLEMMMIRGSDQSYIQFKDFQVPVADEKGIPNILGQQGNGKKVPLLSLNAGRAGFGPLAAASATRLADLSTEHAIDRLMFDMYSKDPEAPGREADMQIVKKHLGQMSINGAMARAASKLVAGLIDANPDRGVAGLSAMIKVMTTDMNFENAQKALDLHGGHGLIKGAPNQMERFFRDAWILLIVEGQNAAMRLFSVLTGSSPVRKAFEKGLKELENRAKHLPSNVGTELKLLASGKIQEAKQHHQETSLFTVSEFKPLIKAQLGKAEQGILSEDEAYWIQSRTLQFSRNFGYVGMRLQERVAQRQNDLARVANIMQDLFQITAAQIELAKMGDKLDPKEKAYLQTGTKLAKARVDRELKFVSMAGNPEEHLLVEAGERAIEADKGVVRPNKQDEHMAFLHGKADKFHQKLAKEFGKQ